MLAVISLALCCGILVYILVYKSEKVLVSKLVNVNNRTSEHLSDNFPRLRFGIGNDFIKGYQSDYVLGNWDDIQLNELESNIDKTKKIIYSFVSIGINLTMNNLNGK